MRDGKSLVPAERFSISFKHQSSRRPMTDRHRMSLQFRRRRLRSGWLEYIGADQSLGRRAGGRDLPQPHNSVAFGR
jgi:hypothetical protein